MFSKIARREERKANRGGEEASDAPDPLPETRLDKLSGQRERTKHCTDHCSECGMHFHSLRAFDAHLKRITHPRNKWGAKEYSLQHLSGEQAGLLPSKGMCSMLSDPTPVQLWITPETTVSDYFNKLKGGNPT